MNRIIIGLKGKAGVGKDTAGKYLVENYGFHRISFAEPLKEIVSILTGWPLPYLEGANTDLRIQRETVKHPVYNMTGREMLQFVGTNLFREQLNPDIWLNIAKQRIIDSDWKKVVITDVRFPNEGEMIESLGGKLIDIQSQKFSITNQHASESGFISKNSIILENNKSLDEFYQKIDEAYQQILFPLD